MAAGDAARPPSTPTLTTPLVAGGTFNDVVLLLEGFRREVIGRMDDLEAKVDSKFDGLPEQYPSRREFNILAGQVAQLESRVYQSNDMRYRDLLTLDRRVDAGQITTLRDEAQRTTTTTASRLRNMTAWQVAFFGVAGAFLANIIFYLMTHATFHP